MFYLPHFRHLEGDVSCMPRRQSLRERCCKVFVTAVSFTVTLICFIVAFALIYQNRDSNMPFSKGIVVTLLGGLVSLTVFIFYITECVGNISGAVPTLPVTTLDTMLRRVKSEQALRPPVEETEDLTSSLPAYILVSTELRAVEALRSARTFLKEARASMADKVELQPLKTSASEESSAATVSKVAAEVAAIVKDVASDAKDKAESEAVCGVPRSDDAQNEAGVRQRKITPMEEQKYTPGDKVV